ncbi:unnamed protein product [Blepharisma stoltei]|uniref:Tyrosine-protein kinase ephrin type A/B receptor-like domain-containing protein n=1 Tax=Blepharisma stoltei TaxID=1481888 RepID=A0AAU9IPS6_9CILI|nr:unnamed protein product [Blepharisma stoltei]
MIRIWLFLFLRPVFPQTFTLIPATGTPPGERQYHILDLYEKDNSLITFGGNQGVSRLYNDVWKFSLSESRWYELQASSQMTPSQRYNLGGFVDSNNDYLYVFGGSSANGPQNDMWQFDLVSYQWMIVSQNGAIPSPRSRFAYVHYKDKNDNKLKFAIYGGTLSTGYDNNLYIFDLESATWSLKSSGGVSVPKLNAPTIQYWNGYIYLAGGQGIHGTASEYNHNFFRYDLANSVWEDITSSSNPYSYRYLTGSAIYNDEFYLLFGWSDLIGADLGNIMKVSLTGSNYSWSNVTIVEDENWNMIRRDSYAFFGSSSGSVYIFGGYSSSYNVTIMNNLIKLDLTSSEITYTVLSYEFKSPSPRKSHSLCSSEAKLYLFGGQNGNDYYNDLWELDPENPTSWQSILTSGDIPSPRSGHASDSQGDLVVIFGGYDGTSYLNDLYYLNLITNSWKEVIPSSIDLPAGRVEACMKVYLPYVFIFGGKTESGITNDLWLYNTGTNSYKLLYEVALGNHPLPVYGHSCELAADTYGNILFYTMLGSTDGEEPIGNVDVFNMTLQHWVNLYLEESGKNARANAAVKLNKYNEVGVLGGQAWGTDLKPSIFVLNLDTDTITSQNSMEDYFYSSASLYYKKSFYIQGGGSVAGEAMRAFLAQGSFIKIELACDTSTNTSCHWTCSPGTYIQNNACVPCPAGTFNPSYGATTCFSCPSGTFNPTKGANTAYQCYPCDSSSYNSFEGSATCRACPVNKYCPVGSSSPLETDSINSYSSSQPSLFDTSSYNSDADDAFNAMITTVCVLFFIIFILFVSINFLRDKLKALDLYKEGHNYQLFQIMKRHSTKLGGTFTIVFLVAAIILICDAWIVYAKNNIYEDKSLVPLVALENELTDFPATVNIEVVLYRYGGNCVDNGKCESSLLKTLHEISYSWMELKCSRSEGNCHISFSFASCVISTGAYIELDLQEKQSYTSAISVSLNSSSSIPNQFSSISQSLLPQKNQVFRGANPSKFYFSMIPSLFRSYVSDWPDKLTGYHVSYNTPPEAGSQYAIKNLPFTSNLKLMIMLNKDLNSVYTQRFEKQGWLTVLSALLGSVFGAMGAVSGVMRIVEKNYKGWKSARETKMTGADISERGDAIQEMLNLYDKSDGMPNPTKYDNTKTESADMELKLMI